MFYKKGIRYRVIEYLIVALIMCALSRAGIFGIKPFSLGFFLALVYLQMNLYILSGIYLFSVFMSAFSPSDFFGAAVVCFVIISVRILEIRLKKVMTIGIISIPALLCQVGQIYILAKSGENTLIILLSVFFSILFMYASICFLRPIVAKKLKYKLLDYEIICGCVVLMIVSLGIASVNVASFPFLPFLALFSICLASQAGGVRTGLIFGICIGIGNALLNNDITMLACYPFVSLLVVAFCKSKRILGAAAGILGYVMFVFYFDVSQASAIEYIISLAAGGMAFVFIPKSYIERVSSYFSGSFTRTALRYVVNHNRQELGDSLFKVSNIFYEMSGLMSGMKNAISDRNVELLYKNVVDDFCSECTKKAICGSSREMHDALEEVIKISVAKGRATVIDLPSKITENCLRIAQLITFASDISTEFCRYIKTMENENAAKLIVSEQLLGVSLVLRDLGVKEAVPLSFDLGKESAIMEELTYRNIICSEALLTESEGGGRATLIILTECIDRQIIEHAVGKIVGKSYRISAVEESIISGWSVVHMEAASRYDVVFGYASCPKIQGESSGDTHSFIKIRGNKFMMAVCDGMGSGENARRFSDATISLIENFYKAGFEHRLVLESVNKFLSLSSEETFSAVDVCVVDLDTAEADLIKIGSPASYIKGNDSVIKVDGCALPIGMLEEIRPSVSTQRLALGDMVILTTDGISDSFNGDELASIINHLGGKNPQALCTKITEAALTKSSPKDDMTIAAFRLLKRTS